MMVDFCFCILCFFVFYYKMWVVIGWNYEGIVEYCVINEVFLFFGEDVDFLFRLELFLIYFFWYVIGYVINKMLKDLS